MGPDHAAPRPFVFALAPTIAGEDERRPDRAAPLSRYLEKALGRPVRLAEEGSYAATLAALREGRIDAAMLGEAASRRGEAEGGIEPLLAPLGADEQPPTYQSVVVTRIDSGIRDLTGLRGATVGLVDEQSTSGYLVPRAMLREAGLDPERDLEIRLFGGHRAVVEAVIAGAVVAGGAHAGRLAPPSLDRGPDYARLRVLARSRPIPLGPLVVRAGLPPEPRQALADAMLRVHEVDPAAAKVLIREGLRFTLAGRRATPTLKSIAALAGVSYATVSRVVNKSGYVAPTTAARVAAIVEELGYRPNGNALSLQGQRPPLVGLLVPSPLAGETADLAERLRDGLAAAGVPLVLCPVAGAVGGSPFPELLRDGRLGALVATAGQAADPALVDLARTGHAVVAVGAARAVPGMVLAAPADAARAVLGALGLPAPATAGA
jgi:phosphonate transport system substrate-binding protein